MYAAFGRSLQQKHGKTIKQPALFGSLNEIGNTQSNEQPKTVLTCMATRRFIQVQHARCWRLHDQGKGTLKQPRPRCAVGPNVIMTMHIAGNHANCKVQGGYKAYIRLAIIENCLTTALLSKLPHTFVYCITIGHFKTETPPNKHDSNAHMPYDSIRCGCRQHIHTACMFAPPCQ